MKTLILRGTVRPKARPRVTGKSAHLPPQYARWKNEASRAIAAQWNSLPLLSADICIIIGGAQNGDLDNLGGAILDVLVQARVLVDDSLMNCSKLSLEWKPLEPRGVHIYLTNCKRTQSKQTTVATENERTNFPII